ncbi:tRNA (adenosine(37)-N6)-dimethylallyltransferase MiaA [Candidatus Curtissbacteria bacterium]|nr:tRNA (adenosine(37)-N6)-dimethylallyltransferase MiaA [Candidatus Curtissbacteria bacterium]
MKKKLIIIYGPTTSGKTSLSIKLAKRLKTEIISADSRQVIEGLDIGTGKFSKLDLIKKEKRYWLIDNIKVNLYDVILPSQTYSVSDFNKDTQNVINNIFMTKDVGIIAGGTGLYVSSLLNSIESIEIAPDQALRNRLAKKSLLELTTYLNKISPEKYQNLNFSDQHNPRRIIRAIEVFLNSQNLQKNEPVANKYDCFFIYLKPDKEILRLRIDSWYQEKLRMGLIEEVKLLKTQHSDEILNSIGLVYREVNRYLNEEISKEYLDIHLPIAIYKYAKNQLTWMRKTKNAHVYEINSQNIDTIQNDIQTDVLDWYNNK